MEQVTEILTDWYHNSRMLYASVTLGSVIALGVVAAQLGGWLARKLGIGSSTVNNNNGRA